MLIQEFRICILNLNDGKMKVVKLREDETCTQGFRHDVNGKVTRGILNKNQRDCHRFCGINTCDSQ